MRGLGRLPAEIADGRGGVGDALEGADLAVGGVGAFDLAAGGLDAEVVGGEAGCGKKEEREEGGGMEQEGFGYGPGHGNLRDQLITWGGIKVTSWTGVGGEADNFGSKMICIDQTGLGGRVNTLFYRITSSYGRCFCD